MSGNGIISNAAIAEPSSPLTEAASDDDFDAFFEGALRAERQKQREADEKEIGDLVSGSLEALYADELVQVSQLAETTTQKYIAAFRPIITWAQEIGIRYLPLTSGAVASYLHERLEGGASYAKLRLIRAAIARCHVMRRHPDPTQTDLIAAVLLRARKGKKTNGKN